MKNKELIRLAVTVIALLWPGIFISLIGLIIQTHYLILLTNSKF
jgi:hypothetical protein